MSNLNTQPSKVDMRETERQDLFPTQEMQVNAFSTENYDKNFPENTFSSHEDMVAVKHSGNSTISMMPRTERTYAQLEQYGYQNGGSNYGVPYTGSGLEQRTDTKFTNISRGMAFNLQGIDNGLRDVDYPVLSDPEKSELELIGFQGTNVDNGALLTGKSNVFTVSRGNSLTVDTEIYARAHDIGTFSKVSVPLSMGLDAKLIAYTDQAGNQAIAPASPTLEKLIASAGYREQDEPTFDTDLNKLAEANNNVHSYEQNEIRSGIHALMTNPRAIHTY